MPLRHLVTSTAFSDQHLRVMLRTNDRAVQVKDRYGNGPLEYLGWNKETTRFQRTVADEARLAIDRADNVNQSLDAVGRVREGQEGLRLLMGVQSALLFHDLASPRCVARHGLGPAHARDALRQGRRPVRGEAATFRAALEGELGSGGEAAAAARAVRGGCTAAPRAERLFDQPQPQLPP